MGDPAADDGEKVAGTAVKNQPPVNEGEETDGKVAAESEAVDADCKAEEKLVVEDRELDEEQKAFVRRQVDFYFCDANLVRDTFLKKSISEDHDGFVDIRLLMTFQRMRTILNIGKEVKAEEISTGLVQSIGQELSDLPDLVVNDDKTRVRRKAPLGCEEEVRKKITERSVHVSNLDNKATLEELEKYFAEHVELHCVWMIRNGKKGFQGAVFLDCKDVDAANEFLEKSLEHNGRILKIVRKSEIIGKEGEERRTRGKGNESSKKNNRNGRGSGRGNRDQRGRGRGRGRGGRGRGRKSVQKEETAVGQENDGGNPENQEAKGEALEKPDGDLKRKAQTPAAGEDAAVKKLKGNTDEDS